MKTIIQFTKQIIAFRDARNWKQFHTPKDMMLALVAEVGELAEHFKWHNNTQMERYIKTHKQEIGEELSDILFWIILMSYEYGIDISGAFGRKMKKNEKKYPVAQYKDKYPIKN